MAENDNALPPIRADVTIALRPETLSPHDAVLVEGSRGRPVLQQTQRAFGEFYKILGHINDARKSAYDQISPVVMRQLALANQGGGNKPPPDSFMGKDGKLTIGLPANTAREFNQAAAEAFQRGAVQLDMARTKAIEVQAELKQLVGFATTDTLAKSPSSIALATEIRSHVKALSPSERMMFIKSQIEEGNLAVASAITNAPPFLWGGDSKLQALAGDMAELKFAPKERAELDSVTKIIQQIMDSGKLATDHLGRSLVPEPALAKNASAAMSRLKTGGR
jgi:hypothetical protein